MNKDLMNTDEAAAYMHITRQGVIVALKRGLKATKKGKRWYISLEDIEEYRLFKHNKQKAMREGQLIFDIEKGLFSVPQVAKILSESLKRPFTVQNAYYLVRSGQLKSFRVGYYYVIRKGDIEQYISRVSSSDKSQLEMSI
jgi:Helix-turn-helix domain